MVIFSDTTGGLNNFRPGKRTLQLVPGDSYHYPFDAGLGLAGSKMKVRLVLRNRLLGIERLADIN